MCGIVGGYGCLEHQQLTSIMNHRGPDDTGHFVDGAVFLGHTRLSIQDLSDAGHQPLKASDESAIIVYNGEIYNTDELRAGLAADGFIFRGHSDTEIILNLYLKLGVKLLDRLNGIFAFAIWDRRTSELFLARDGLGVKPLYYTNENSKFMFASELKALLVDPALSRSINTRSVVNHLTYLWSPYPDTMLEGISKLEPGHAIIVREGAITRKWRFYDLPYSPALVHITEDEAIEETRRLISQAVQRQMISDVPLGAFLSGGLDSSAVVAFAKQHFPDQKLQTFSIDLQGMSACSEGLVDDLPYARRVADHLGVQLNVITVGSEIINDLERMIYHLDEPQADPAPLNVLRISKFAREQGIKVLLSGAGGDDIFTGYRRHYALMQERYWSWLPYPVRSMLSTAAQCLPASNHVVRRISKAFQYAGLDNERRLISYFYWLNPELIHDILSPSIKSKMADYDVACPMLRTLDELPDGVHPLNKMLYLEAKHFLADHNLNYTDKMGMAEGVEVRVPLLDPDLVAFATSLPVDYKQRGRTGKWIFKKAMEGILPIDVIYRPKTGFAAPLRYWLRNELKELVDDVLSEGSLLKRGLLDPAGVERLRKLDAEGKLDAAYPIFSMVCMELWCRIFIDRPMHKLKFPQN